ncbi:MAG: hypothetical protein ACREGL_00800 [Alphaproteobacteria bacterium]
MSDDLSSNVVIGIGRPRVRRTALAVGRGAALALATFAAGWLVGAGWAGISQTLAMYGEAVLGAGRDLAATAAPKMVYTASDMFFGIAAAMVVTLGFPARDRLLTRRVEDDQQALPPSNGS